MHDGDSDNGDDTPRSPGRCGRPPRAHCAGETFTDVCADARECRRAGGATERAWAWGRATGSRSRCGNGPEMVLAYFGTTLCGTAAPLNPNYKQDEFAFYFEDTSAKALITLPDTLPAAHAAATDDMTIIEALPQPDGTLDIQRRQERPTRPPRSARRAGRHRDDPPHERHDEPPEARADPPPQSGRFRAQHRRHLRALGGGSLALRDAALPHPRARRLDARYLRLGRHGDLPGGGFNALEFWKIVDAFKPTWYSAVPTMHQTLLARADRNMDVIKANPFRFIRSGSSSLAPIVMERMEATFGAPVLENYGMTEATHQMTSNPLPPKPHKAGTVGYGFGVDVGDHGRWRQSAAAGRARRGRHPGAERHRRLREQPGGERHRLRQRLVPHRRSGA